MKNDIIWNAERLDEEEMNAMRTKRENKGGKVNMCEGLRGMIEDGKIAGEYTKTISVIRKACLKQMDPINIAELVDKDVAFVVQICNIVKEHPEYSAEDICKQMDEKNDKPKRDPLS